MTTASSSSASPSTSTRRPPRSTPSPTRCRAIIGGVPIRLRSIQVNIDRPNFTINPTNCTPFTVDSQGIGDQGTVANFSSPYTAVNCATLPFKPKMSVKQVGGAGARRTKNPDTALRPADPRRRRQHQIARGHPPQGLRDRPAPPRQHLLGERTGRDRVRRPQPDRQSDDEDTAAGPAPERAGLRRLRARAACRGWPSSSTARSICVPRADTKSLNGGQLKTTVPVVPDAADRPLPPDHLRRQDAAT